MFLAKKSREYEAIKELKMAETTITAEPKKGTPAKKVAAKVEVKKEVVEEPKNYKRIGIFIGLGLIGLLVLSNIISGAIG